MKRRQTHRGFEIEKSFYINGKRSQFDKKRLREFRELVDVVFGVFGPMHGYRTDQRERSAQKWTTLAEQEKNSPTMLFRYDGDDVFMVIIPRADGDLLISQPETPKHTFEVYDASGLITVDPDQSQFYNDDLIISLSRDGVVEIEDDGSPLEFMEQVGDELEEIRDYHGNMM